MKIKPEHYEHIKNAVAYNAPKLKAHREFLRNEGKSKDIEKRLRWDLLHAAGLTSWICKNLYTYLHDEHIDTALKAIVKEMEAA